jgi:hypothetical protein
MPEVFAFEIQVLFDPAIRRRTLPARSDAVSHTDGETLDAFAENDHGCEGIISKRAGSLYGGGQNRDWPKIKPPAVLKRQTESVARSDEAQDGPMSESILQELYDSEINAELSTLWDSCFDWKLGDALNSHREQGQGRSLSEAIAQLRAAALRSL